MNPELLACHSQLTLLIGMMFRYFLPFVSAFCIVAPTQSSWSASPTEDLDAFSAKVAKSIDDQRPEGAYRQNVVTQFRMLKGAIDRGDFETARQLLRNMNGGGLPPDLAEEWQPIGDRLAEQIGALEQESAISWKRSVDGLAAEIRGACVAAKTSADLDEVLIKTAALQMKRTSSNNILVQRASQKLEALAGFLDQWTRFLDFREAGNTKQANYVLRNLAENGGSSGFPVLPAAELEKLLVVEEPEITDPMQLVRTSLENVKSVAELPAVTAELSATLKSPKWGNRQSYFNPNDLLLLVDADRALKAGDFSQAQQSLNAFESSNLASNARQWMAPLVDPLNRELLAGQVEQITGVELATGESVDAMLRRICDKLRAEGKYAELAGIMKASTSLRSGMRSRVTEFPWTSEDLVAVESYASASQLEKADDALAAVNEYRRVITEGQGGKYAPTKQAEEALTRLRKSNPEAFKDLNGAVLEQLRQMRQDIDRALRMQTQMQMMRR